jgi:hypothetical protein
MDSVIQDSCKATEKASSRGLEVQRDRRGG